MNNILVLNFFPAFVPPKNGGEVRLFNFYLELSQYYNITLLSSGHLNSDAKTVHHANGFTEKIIPKDSFFVERWQHLIPHGGGGDLSGPCIAVCGKDFTALHEAYLFEYASADLIIHDCPFTLGYDLFLGLDKKPRIYNSYNCEFELYKKLHLHAPSSRISEIVFNTEVALLKSVDLVTYCGEDDKAAFEGMLKGQIKHIKYSPNGMTVVSNLKNKSINEKKLAVFIGSAHPPNVTAANYIVETLAPAYPRVSFHIIGGCLAEGSYTGNVFRHGMVDQQTKSEIMASASIAINPMQDGGGSSLKILDFASYGIPVISTSIGMRGFEFKDTVDCILAEIKDFPKLLLSYIDQPQLLEKFGVAAKKLATQKYSWQAVAKNYAKDIDVLLGAAKKNQEPDKYVLALNDYNPFTTVGGGATRLLGIYKSLAEWSHVVVLCFSENSEFQVQDVSAKIRCVCIPKSRDHTDEEYYLNSRFHISVNDIVAIRHAGSNRLLNAIYEVLREDARIVVCEHPYMVALPDRYGDRFVYSSQNFELGLKTSLLQWHPDKDLLIEATRAAEELCVSTSAAVIAVSIEDGQNLSRGLQAGSPIYVVPNGAGDPVEASAEDLLAAKRQIGRNAVVFLGSGHMPNVDAAKFVVETLSVQCPGAEFHIVGSVCQALDKGQRENVVLWGVLTDSMKSAVLQQCQIAVNPMLSGSGSNIKLADYIANGLFVVSTGFGVRGYPDVIAPHVSVVEVEKFSEKLKVALSNSSLWSKGKRTERRLIFNQNLSMSSLGMQFVDVLRDLEKPKKRILFVTYRYTGLTLGGAESMLATLVKSAGQSGDFEVDAISTEVSEIENSNRFGAKYSFDKKHSAPVNIGAVRFRRFAVDNTSNTPADEACARAWRTQSEFEKQLYVANKLSVVKSGLAWGWGDHEGSSATGRWAFSECGIHLNERLEVKVAGFVPRLSTLLVRNASGDLILHQVLDSYFEISFAPDPGAVQFNFSYDCPANASDLRPLAAYVNSLMFGNSKLDLSAAYVHSSIEQSPMICYSQMSEAATLSRNKNSLRLTDIRGPHSGDMERFIEENISQYDIVVTHNSVFRPAVVALSAAKAAGVPSILIPHAHLDDDFYHFADVHQAALDASLVFAAPRAACDFYKHIGASSVEYLPSGINVEESFTQDDELAFRSIYTFDLPFFLILGRKAAAKGYADVVRAIDLMASKHKVNLVLIGPDDDGIPIDSKNVTYLGQQPRNVVRGALKTCVALVNMSHSESFGIVLLEAWLAGRPVIVNSACTAFRDLAIHMQNGFLVTKDTLEDALIQLLDDSHLAEQLGSAGLAQVKEYSLATVCGLFLKSCRELVSAPVQRKQRHFKEVLDSV